jgi:hypothetical protein
MAAQLVSSRVVLSFTELVSLFSLLNILLSMLSPYIDEIIGNHQLGFDITDQLLIRFSAFFRYCRRNGNTMRHYIGYT